MSIETQQLRAKLDELASVNGSGTQMISVYIPADSSIFATVQSLNQEHAEAGNIKSKETRKRVQGSLSKILNILKQYKQTPENGIVIFSGYINEQDDYMVRTFDEFPVPISDSVYHCDNDFYVEPLKDLVAADGEYVMLVLDKNDAVIGEVVGTQVRPVETLSSLVPGKQKKGGQSQRRFERLRKEAAVEFYKEIAESINNRYVDQRHELDGLFIGSPEPTQSEFIDGNYLHHELQDKILCRTSISTTTEAGLRQLLKECESSMEEQEVTEQREYCENFFKSLAGRGDNPVAYGPEETLQALNYGAVNTLLVSESLSEEVQSELLDEDSTDIFARLQDLSEEYGSDIMFISDTFEEGKRFKQVFSGIGAILRYPIN